MSINWYSSQLIDNYIEKKKKNYSEDLVFVKARDFIKNCYCLSIVVCTYAIHQTILLKNIEDLNNLSAVFYC